MAHEVDLVSTGIDGLDEVLLGGVPRGNICLVEGAPGTGKTTLGLEFVYRGAAEFGEPGLIITFELSPERLLRDVSTFGWDFAELEEQGLVKVIYTSPFVLVQELQSHDGILVKEIERLGARRVLVDGLTPVLLFAESSTERPFRESLQLLIETLQRMGVTGMLTRELGATNEAYPHRFPHEQFLCDTIVTLRGEARGRGMYRSLEVQKSRGQNFLAGRHTIRIEAGSGVHIYRRAQSPPQVESAQPTSDRRLSIGNAAIDDMLGGGVYEGSVTLVVGVSGTGKTVLGTQFLTEGAQNGEKGLLVTLDEHPHQLVRNAAGIALPLDRYLDEGSILAHYDSPQELELDVHFHTIARLIDEHAVRRVLIDSLSAYLWPENQSSASREFIYALTDYLKARLITACFTYESPELLGVSQISQDLKASTIGDNIVLLNYVEVSNRLRRAITVPKARGSDPSRETREFEIGSGGIKIVGEEAAADPVPQLPFHSYYGVLARSPARRSPIIDKQVLAGELTPGSDESDENREPE